MTKALFAVPALVLALAAGQMAKADSFSVTASGTGGTGSTSLNFDITVQNGVITGASGTALLPAGTFNITGVLPLGAGSYQDNTGNGTVHGIPGGYDNLLVKSDDGYTLDAQGLGLILSNGDELQLWVPQDNDVLWVDDEKANFTQSTYENTTGNPIQITPNPLNVVPEPAPVALLGTGMLALLGLGLRKSVLGI